MDDISNLFSNLNYGKIKTTSKTISYVANNIVLGIYTETLKMKSIYIAVSLN